MRFIDKNLLFLDLPVYVTLTAGKKFRLFRKNAANFFKSAAFSGRNYASKSSRCAQRKEIKSFF